MGLDGYIEDKQRLLGMNDSEFAAFAGLTQPLISHLKTGRRRAGIETVLKLIERFPGDRDAILLAAKNGRRPKEEVA